MAESPKILIEGEITEHQVPALLNYLFDQEASGRLVLVQEGVNKTIYTIAGVPANVDSSMRDETLGRFLVKQGRITEEDYERSVEVMMGEGIQQGAALVKLGLIAPKELYKTVKEQNLQKLLTAFSFQEGQYRFYSEVEFIEKIYRFEFQYHQVLKQGVFQYFPETALQNELAKLGPEPIRPLVNFEERLARFGLDEDEMSFAQIIDGSRNCVELIEFEELYPFAKKLLYVFLLCGLAGPDGALAHALRSVGEQHLAAGARTEMAMPSADSPEAEPETEPEVTIKTKQEHPDKILEFYIQLKNKDYFELLDAAPEDGDPAIEDAYRRRLFEFSRDRFPERMAQEHEDRLEEINAEIIKAYEGLRTAERRAAYQEELNSKQSKKSSQDHLRAEKFLQEGVKYVRMRDFVNAQKMFEWATQLSPNEPEYFGYLGWTIFCNPELEQGHRISLAKEKLNQAIKMNPNMDSAHVFLGKVLASEGLEDEAVQEFRSALKANPNCREARRELGTRGIEE
jgi:tetratricopeptide (TPR) repeat protein